MDRSNAGTTRRSIYGTRQELSRLVRVPHDGRKQRMAAQVFVRVRLAEAPASYGDQLTFHRGKEPPMMDRLTHLNNRLLAMLPEEDLGLLAPHLQTVALKQDAVLMQSGERIEHVYFPHSGTVALMVDMPSGQTVACAIVGREGALGALSVLGPSRSTTSAVIRSSGAASQISASRFHVAVGQSRAIRRMVEIHARAVLAQIQQVAACNALHPVENRMARWLLHIHDRMESNVLPITQETLAQLLGVRRTTVTQAVQKLRASGAVRYDRRARIEVVDRPRLEEGACECYEIIHRQIELIFSQQTLKPSLGKPEREAVPVKPPVI